MGKNCLKYACLFGGGAIRGAAHVGVVKALEELNIYYDTIGGSSVGSIVAALLGVGYTAEELREVFLQANFELFRDIQFNLGEKFAISKGEIFLEWVRELIEKKYYGENYAKGNNPPVKFTDIEKNLVIITTDLTNFCCREFSKKCTPDFEIATAVRISSCMPGLMKPYEYNNSLLVDGDLQKSWPMWRLSESLKNLDERILEIRLEGDCGGNDMNTLNYVNTVYSCVTSIATEFVIDRYSDNDKYDFVVINTGDIIIIDFNQSKENREKMMNSGYKETIKYFKEHLPEKKEHLFEIYDRLSGMLNNVDRAIFSGNIKKAKMLLGEIFMYLSDNDRYIDAGIFSSIQKYKNKFLDNIKYPALFGRTKLKNAKEMLIETESILSAIKNKILEMKDYNLLIGNKNIDN